MKKFKVEYSICCKINGDEVFEAENLIDAFTEGEKRVIELAEDMEYEYVGNCSGHEADVLREDFYVNYVKYCVREIEEIPEEEND